MDLTRSVGKPWHLGHHDANPYFAFTDACNSERSLIIFASSQACVWYKLTLASKKAHARLQDAAVGVLPELVS